MNPATNPANASSVTPAGSGDDGSGLPASLADADAVLPKWASRRVVTIPPGTALDYVESEWRDAIVLVTAGDVVLQGRLDGALWLTCGDIFWFDGIDVRVVHNHGAESAVLTGLSRGSGRTADLRLDSIDPRPTSDRHDDGGGS